MASSSETNPFARDATDTSTPAPPINVRYFYTSPLAIDDPLSPVPPPQTGSATASRQPPRPFSTFDNAALEKTWLQVRQQAIKESDRSNENVEPGSSKIPSGSDGQQSESRPSTAKKPIPVQRKQSSAAGSLTEGLSSTPRRVPIGAHRRSTDSRHGVNSVSSSLRAYDGTDGGFAQFESASLTGNPFVRAPSRSDVLGKDSNRSRAASIRPGMNPADSYNWGEDDFAGVESPTRETSRAREPLQPKKAESPSAKVPVGVSRLHNVVFPDFQMEPIYWSPVNDIAPVVRGTWFYHDSMLPVEADIANLLEAGYISLGVWTDTWTDELASAVEVGAFGEMKVLHKLWPEVDSKPSSRPQTGRATITTELGGTVPEPMSVDPEKERQETAANAGDFIDITTGAGDQDNNSRGTAPYGRDGTVRSYRNAGVIYANANDAYILRSALQPSDYYGRRPLANYIRKGRNIGIRVVRGFDQEKWDKLHPPKGSAKAKKAQEGVSSSGDGYDPTTRQLRDPTLAGSERPEVTDLVLVIHGIGQKLSERVENYHFTHAINTFRRDVNVQLGDDLVKLNLRKDVGGIMVLPVNWRLTLSFEDGGYREDDDPGKNDYTLQDITPHTLPSVRNIVSDVLLDIPYYLTAEYSDKMIKAIVREANRIYRLWCINNPGFSNFGRVHFIAHSLGSVMAVDILSKQPTHVQLPKDVVKLSVEELPSDHFAFDVTNLFVAGSPVGFFLLLKRSALLPRRGRNKPGSEDSGDDTAPGVVGEQGTYGCIAVDNIYNIVNPYDPVAYNLNAAVDSDYAGALKPAFVPSADRSWFSIFKSAPSTSTTAFKPSIVPRLPSNVELETHNFTREEIAEKKVFLLNDNGQIDWFLRYGGGPLEIQYLTMLGAHSSYWIHTDFVRLLVCEIGRRQGRAGTLAGMRAQKKKKVPGAKQ